MRLLLALFALLAVSSASLLPVSGFRFTHRLPIFGGGKANAIADKIESALIDPPQVLPRIDPMPTPTAPVTNSSSAQVDFPGRLLRSLKLDAHEIARGSLESLERESVVRQISQVVLPSQDSGCCACVGKVAHHVIDATFDQIKTACANVTCPVIKAECQWIEDHEERYKGYLVARIRPAGLGFSYCMGTGECQHPNYTAISTILAEPKTNADAMYLPFQAEEFLGKLLSGNSQKNSSTAWSKLFDDVSSETNTKSQLAENLGGDEDDKDGRRHKCMRRVVKKILKHALKHLKHVCKHTQCPRMQKFCAWAKEHKETVRGYMYGKIEPWKFAVGFCAARRHDAVSLA